jgi:hypothetical protein
VTGVMETTGVGVTPPYKGAGLPGERVSAASDCATLAPRLRLVIVLVRFVLLLAAVELVGVIATGVGVAVTSLDVVQPNLCVARTGVSASDCATLAPTLRLVIALVRFVLPLAAEVEVGIRWMLALPPGEGVIPPVETAVPDGCVPPALRLCKFK